MKKLKSVFTYWPLFLFILLTIFLRIPSLAEPYWYGDEGISLNLAQGIRRGLLIYKDIVDNKPPLLYLIMAIGGTMYWIKLATLLWSVATITVFYFLAKELIGRPFNYLTVLGLAVFINLPLFEGNIANAEIYFIMPVALGMLLLWHARSTQKPLSLFFIGTVFSAGALFKIPAALDFAGAALFLTALERQFLPARLWRRLFFLAMGFLTPFLLTAVYFFFRGAISDFWQHVFLSNLVYSAWGNNFRKFYLLLLVFYYCWLFFKRSKLAPQLLLVMMWLPLAILGSRLSVRPYAHYLIQILPPAFLLMGILLQNLKKHFYLSGFLLFIFGFILPQFDFNQGAFSYQVKYFQNYIDYTSGKKSLVDYQKFFDPHVPRTYAAAAFVKNRTQPGDKLFIWGDDPLVYLLAERYPVGKYSAAYHIKDWDLDFKDTILGLTTYQPKYILVSTERVEVFPFPFLKEFLGKHYQPADQFADLIVYQRL